MKSVHAMQVMEMFLPLWGKVPKEHLRYLMHRLENEKPHQFNGRIRLNSFFPPYPSPAFDRFCRAISSRKRIPLSLYLAVTDRCPCRCGHCSYAGREIGRMSHDKMLDVIEQIKKLGTCTLGITGGEPLLRDDLEDFIAAAEPDMATVLFTTGFGLQESRARKIVDAGVTCVTIGIETSNPEEHDAFRGLRGSFDAARQAIDMFNHAGAYTAISTVGKREKIHSGELERLYELCRRWDVKELRVIPPVATGAVANCPDIMLSDREYQFLSDFHINHNTAPGDGPVIAGFAYIESEKLFGCGAGYHHLFIDANGEVCPCDLTPLGFGNVNQEPLEKIWNRMGEFFPKPSCGCLMGKIARSGKLADYATLPLPPEESVKICPRPEPNAPIPEGYRLLLQNQT